MAMADVTVRGAGIYGLTVAWECLRRGARVSLVDPNGVASGASGGVVGALSPHAPDRWTETKALQLATLLAAEAFWAEVDSVSGRGSGYGRTGRLTRLDDDAAVATARAREAEAAERWRGRAEWRVVSTDPAWMPSPTGLAVHDTLTARLHPARACASLAAALRARGVEVVADAPDAGAVVWATGPAGLADLSRALGREVGRGIKGQAVVLARDLTERPQLYAGGLHIVPHDDATVGIGSTTEREFDAPETTDGRLDELLERALTACRALRGAPVVRRWAGVRPRSRSRSPILGPWPGRPGHFVANGGFKIGFGTAIEVARLTAELVLEGRDAIPPALTVEACL